MTRRIHAIAGLLAFSLVATFWIASVASELFGSTASIVLVKTTIPWGFLILVPAIAATGGSGFTLARRRSGAGVGTKLRRMPIIAANGLVVLIPSALYLAAKADASDFDAGFYLVQALELIAGAINLALLGLNIRDGLRLSGKRQPRRLSGAAQTLR
jgi:hypothetical protein